MSSHLQAKVLVKRASNSSLSNSSSSSTPPPPSTVRPKLSSKMSTTSRPAKPRDPKTPVVPRVAKSNGSLNATLHSGPPARSPRTPQIATTTRRSVISPDPRPSSAASNKSSRTDLSSHYEPGKNGFQQHRNMGSNNNSVESKFFHASDAGNRTTPKTPTPAPLSNNGPKFFSAAEIKKRPASTVGAPPILSPNAYDSRQLGEPTPPASRPSSVVGPPVRPQRPTLAPSLAPERSFNNGRNVKFLYANGTEEVLAPRKKSGSEVGSGVNSPQLSASPDLGNPHLVSPIKNGFPISPLSSPHPHPSASSSPQQQAFSDMLKYQQARNRAGSEVGRHGRSVSIGSALEMTIPSSPSSEDKDKDTEVSSTLSGSSQSLHSPKEALATDPLEAVLNARRERKVLDLEIQNATLTAINKRLERQLKKQAAELERFRRLELEGRLIPRSTADPALEDSDDDFLSADEGERPVTPQKTRQRSASVRTDVEVNGSEMGDDEEEEGMRRFETDLSRHRELLDNQRRMNQSLRRCALRTEAMMEEAKRSLEERVDPSEIRLGGRVLEADEESTAGTETDVEPDTEDEDDDEDEGRGDGVRTPTRI